jgi:hypothetical protein
MRRIGLFAASIALFVVGATSASVRAAGGRPDESGLQMPVPLEALLRRSAVYLDSYQTKLATVIAEESYTLRSTAHNGGNVDLTSDILLIGVTGGSWVEFRDVFRVNNRDVRDHQARLEALLSSPSDLLTKAQQIADESARYNGKTIPRNINVPTMALTYLMGSNQPRSTFQMLGTAADQKTTVVGFQETARPPLVHAPVGVVATSGRFWIDTESGAVTKSELTLKQEGADAKTKDAMASGTITVTYADDPKLKILVPVEMEESYDRPALVRCKATYSHYKAFSVDVKGGG